MQLERVAAAQAQGRRVSVWFADEARVGQKNLITRVWGETGSRPSAPKDQRYANAYIFGAVCPMERKAAAIVVSRCNTTAMNLHLAEISSQVGADTLAVLVLDGAGWHKSKDLVVPENIVLIHLPPYSPELNPVERIWRFLRSHFLSNRVFADGAAVIDASLDAWNRFIAVPERIASLCYVAWAIPPENTQISAPQS